MYLEDKGSTFGGSLESPQGLLLVFCPQILEVGEDLRIIFFPQNESSSSDEDNQR